MSTHSDPYHRPDRLSARALRYLNEKFSLTEADVQGEEKLTRLLQASPESFDALDRLIIEDVQLFRKSVRNALVNLGLDSEESDLARMTEMVRKNIGTSFEGVETFLEGFHPLEVADQAMDRLIPAARADVLEEMDEQFGHVTEGWAESRYALDDKQLAERFIAPVGVYQRALSTYFDSACVGLVDRDLQSRVSLLGQQNSRKDWSSFLVRMKTRITRALEQVKPGEERRFVPENCFFQPNGTEAFRRLRESCMKPGQRVLATREEYFEIIEDMVRNHIQVTPFGCMEEMLGWLDSGQFDYMLVSEVGRTGTVHPLREFDEARRLLSPNTRLIVDSAQSAGRWKHDLGACHADAVILSTQKGSDLGMGKGVVALAHGFERGDMADQAGTLRPEEIARTAFSLNPEGLRTLHPAQRAEAVSENTKKFLDLLSAVNTRTGNRIRILSPSDIGGPMLGHAIELSVSGVSRQTICEQARAYGVYIADSYVSPKSDESFRVAFHPYMNNDALKILAYALLQACESDQDE